MAIYHCSVKPLSRTDGRSAVSAAAYRAAERLTDERQGVIHNFQAKSGVLHTEIVLPDGVRSSLASDRNELWNAAEVAERRKDARTAREIVIALPSELDENERRELAHGFAQSIADKYGVAVDVAIHAPSQAGDERNHHAHLLMTTRQIGAEGLGEKSMLEREDKWLRSQRLPVASDQVALLRIDWETQVNEALTRAGHDIRVDARSHQERGLSIEPTQHAGVHASAIDRRGGEAVRRRIDPAASRENVQKIMDSPDGILDVITNEKSVFDRRDIARTLHRYIDDPSAYQAALTKTLTSGKLIKLQDEYRGEDGQTIAAKYTTRKMFDIEHGMAERVDRMAQAKGFAVETEQAIRRFEKSKGFTLKEEQATAVRHVTGDDRIATVTGLAGAGKSTMLGAANAAWTAGGHRVFGAALSGKAADGLEESAGIKSYTLAKWEHQWKQGKMALQRGDVFVIDEAGMVGSEQMARFVKAVDDAGGKLVLVGDAEQLQAINAGAAFRAVAERVGGVDLETITRQKEPWMREASVAFGRKRTGEALATYAEHGAIQFHDDRDATLDAIIRDAVADTMEWPDGSRVVLAHRNDDVKALNKGIRTALKQAGKLGTDCAYVTQDGPQMFAQGDRVVFLENSKKLGVKNGTLGTVIVARDGSLTVQLDDRGGVQKIAKQVLGSMVNIATRRQLVDTSRPVFVTVNDLDYAKIAHGYATTVHKSQGATVDQTFVLASDSMDRHLAYVAMTRHRIKAMLYVARSEFADLGALTKRLSRSNAKETTLDYTLRRGLAPASEIVVPPAMERAAADAAAGRVADKPQHRAEDTERDQANGRARKAYADRLAGAVKAGVPVLEAVARAELQRADELIKAGELITLEGRDIQRAGNDAMNAFRVQSEPSGDALRARLRGGADPFTALRQGTRSGTRALERPDEGQPPPAAPSRPETPREALKRQLRGLSEDQLREAIKAATVQRPNAYSSYESALTVDDAARRLSPEYAATADRLAELRKTAAAAEKTAQQHGDALAHHRTEGDRRWREMGSFRQLSHKLGLLRDHEMSQHERMEQTAADNLAPTEPQRNQANVELAQVEKAAAEAFESVRPDAEAMVNQAMERAEVAREVYDERTAERASRVRATLRERGHDREEDRGQDQGR